MNYVLNAVFILWPLWLYLVIVGLIVQPWRRRPRG